MVANFSHSATHSTIHRFPAGHSAALQSTMKQSGRRHFVIWMDAVGGFLVCRGDHVHLGQAVPGNRVDVPLQADISRHHASIRRDQEGYLLLPNARVLLDGQLIAQPTTLCDGQEIDLGGAVKLEFRRPHPLSATARLTVKSHHRLSPPVDAVLLLADSCVIGPATTSHIVARQMTSEAVLFEQDGKLAMRGAQPLTIDGTEHVQPGLLAEQSRVSGEDFSLSVESL
ncbi:MAG: FHA domain-containing protein [Planctomycetota bacterium]|nr:MAG: FHA domain-containing protein [Planctomycetota bacterium]REJ87185.1 MAG: FHA domain-containing protein [Planctomycetota bacterium]REK23851.1 MAG: FHA domain-containing protein [Planctomycetota bacterium]REK44714.1 MAG: FHA domain-containing protein [Planctomycetota bacterium]